MDVILEATYTLGNVKAGWVSRRDAAENLGKAACQAILALQRAQDEPDVDVQRAVIKAMDDIRATQLNPDRPAQPAAPPSLKELAEALEKPGKRSVSATSEGYAIRLTLPEGRLQTVNVCPFTDHEGVAQFRFLSPCCEIKPECFQKALRANAQITVGSLCIGAVDGEPRILMVRFLDATRVTPREFKAMVKQVAFYADWVEQRLGSGDDVF